jgi:hypothetical protein
MDMLNQLPGAAPVRLFQTNGFYRMQGSGEPLPVIVFSG